MGILIWDHEFSTVVVFVLAKTAMSGQTYLGYFSNHRSCNDNDCDGTPFCALQPLCSSMMRKAYRTYTVRIGERTVRVSIAPVPLAYPREVLAKGSRRTRQIQRLAPAVSSF